MTETTPFPTKIAVMVGRFKIGDRVIIEPINSSFGESGDDVGAMLQGQYGRVLRQVETDLKVDRANPRYEIAFVPSVDIGRGVRISVAEFSDSELVRAVAK